MKKKMKTEKTKTEEKEKRPEQCMYISYAVSPQHQPIIADNTFYCKFCGNEVEIADCMFPGVILKIWFHKSGGKFITLPEDVVAPHRIPFISRATLKKRGNLRCHT